MSSLSKYRNYKYISTQFNLPLVCSQEREALDCFPCTNYGCLKSLKYGTGFSLLSICSDKLLQQSVTQKLLLHSQFSTSSQRRSSQPSQDTPLSKDELNVLHYMPVGIFLMLSSRGTRRDQDESILSA